MKRLSIILLALVTLVSCSLNTDKATHTDKTKSVAEQKADELAQQVKDETLRSWKAYKKYAWGHDVLAPLTRSFKDWYNEPLYISPIDAYSTLHLMGLTNETREIENYVVDSLNFDKDVDAKIFEVNIRILGGLLAMYEISGNQKVLDKAADFADRMLKAFDTKTGIPKYWVNLKTGVASGDTVNVAEAGSYTFEMGILSYYTQNPKYYQAGKKATLAIFERRSAIGLIGDVIDVETGEWVGTQSHLCAGVDSYYEYLYKSYLLFGDPELGDIWEESIKNINHYLAEDFDNKLWYGRVDMQTGEHVSSVITLYDAFFPAILALSGDVKRAEKLQATWQWLWDKYGLEPMVYDYKKAEPNYPAYDLNPEIIESAYYLLNATGDTAYFNMNRKFWQDVMKNCRTEVAFTSIENVETMEQKDYMPTFFFAETLKYFYLTFSHHQNTFNFDEYLFNTEAHQFKRAKFDNEKAKNRLGIQEEQNTMEKKKSSMLGLRTTLYNVPDLNKAKLWYAEAFGVDPYFDEPFYVGFNIGGYELGLLPDETSSEGKAAGVVAYWGVENIQEVYSQLIKLGATEHEKPFNVGGELMTGSVKDPWGNVIGLIYNPEFKLSGN